MAGAEATMTEGDNRTALEGIEKGLFDLVSKGATSEHRWTVIRI